MKIAFTVAGTDMSAAIDPRFGRCFGFLIYNLDDDTFAMHENKNREAAHGAGIQSAESLVRSGAQAVITGQCGPKAFQVLRTAGIKIFATTATGVADALTLYRQGRLPEISAPHAQGRGR
ncbi:NifB/NifX family molybdenum-iron cluster-binding protein [Desulfobulbus oligotrophicus]|jgi:predicted Fe-Mo cluster-binding NifX family protein|uniref:NifB/NifX family molybdenum-iron cluster-binding protein n=1 Tax=Desulfobulbus oligotrophicus TaxID=1909699 RepID=A0A7T5VCP3_9BACT|nr:NifB/NifX family molybdenum-iron cluster-binding protein [Desulfobulbus oligotrophicus]MDY0389628.1 NifB/NifX family molybdenum-iron cluster-binding protein [Desulfobulbus oligotrophicus]QQG65458.1 NifB/NifX family molybdenum-iron cluster-binding protein [Desulfobulbus oligotrophicus]